MIGLGFTAFFEPLVNTFGWSYTQISLAASLRGAETGLLGPVTGLLVDRWGPRRLMVAGVILTGFGLVFLSYTNSLGMFYGGFAIVALGISCCTFTVVTTTLANWFRKKIGIVIGITASGFSLASFFVPLVVKLIDMFDWRMALLIIGLTICIIGLPLSLLFRHKPEQYGYLPDGEQNLTTVHDQSPVRVEVYDVEINTKQALKSRTFWHIGIASLFHYFIIGIISTHIMPYLSSIGIPRSTASLMAMTAPLIGIPSRLGAGWLGDKFNTKLVAAAFSAIMMLGLFFSTFASSELTRVVMPFLILFGIGWGGIATLRGVMIREYFGRNKFGTIFGFTAGMVAVGMIIGPLFAGWVFDKWASYQITWFTSIILAFVSTAVLATVPPVKIDS
ncbi:MFS transporter [Chloroflexota bacterium]